MPLLTVLKHFMIKVLGELNRALRAARWAHPAFLAAKRYQQRVLAAIAVYARYSVL